MRAPTIRPLTPAERESLAAELRPAYTWHFVAGVAGLGAGAACTLLALLLWPLGVRLSDTALLVTALLGAGAGAWQALREGRRLEAAGAARRAQVRAALARGEAEEWRLVVTDAIALAEPHDGEPSFLLRLADGRTLFLSGQYLDPFVGDRQFPQRGLRLVRVADMPFVLDVRPGGPPVPVSTERDWFTTAEQAADWMPTDGAFVTRDFDAWRVPASATE